MNSSQQPVLRTEAKTIDGMSFECTVFPALFGLKTKGKLLKVIGPALGSLVQGLKPNKAGSVLDANMDMGMVGDALSAITQNLDDPNVVDLIKSLLTSTRVDGQEMTDAVINIKFAGNYLTLYKALLFVIETNRFFGSGSIGDLATGLNAPKTPTQSAKS